MIKSIDTEKTYYNQITIEDNTKVYVQSIKSKIDKLTVGDNVAADKYFTYLNNLIECSGNAVNTDDVVYNTLLEDTDTTLYPCFNSAFIQDREEAQEGSLLAGVGDDWISRADIAHGVLHIHQGGKP